MKHDNQAMEEVGAGESEFKALFAPHPGLLPTSPDGYMDQLRFAYDLGFRAWEDNDLLGRERSLWDEIGGFCADHDFTMGVSVITGGHGYDFSDVTRDQRGRIEADMLLGVELCKATGQKYMTYVPGVRNGDPREVQIRKSADVVSRCCDLVEEHGIILCLEPISHPLAGKEPLLKSFEDGYLLCESVNRASCKLLADFYHEGEIGNGDAMISNAERVWEQVAYLQIGDSPGRMEPGTGALDYPALLQWLRRKGFSGVIGMEHEAKGSGKAGLDALLSAYRSIDA